MVMARLPHAWLHEACSRLITACNFPSTSGGLRAGNCFIPYYGTGKAQPWAGVWYGMICIACTAARQC